jgi:hypothetical protein
MTLDVDGVGGGVVRVRNDRLIGVARTELLAILQRHARRPGWRWSSAGDAARPIWMPTSSSPPTG